MGTPRESHNEGFNYISLREMLVDYKITMDEDDYASSASDYAMRNFALRGIREFGFDVQPRVRSIKRSVHASNNTITLPDDFVDIVKLGVVDDNGVVRAFAENKNINISQKLVDPSSTSESSDVGGDNFTNTGNRRVLSDNNINDREDDQTSTISDGNNDDLDWYVFENYLYQGGLGRLYGLGGGKLRGNYRINYDQNRIEIDSEAGVTEVVLEYISDAARSSDPVVHVYAEEALRAYVYYKIVERKSSVPAGEKQRARAEYYNERRKARIRLSNFSKEQALNTIRKNFKLAPKY
jgi:hypothetical protein|tara:strand:+ start:5033 stop:5917 length:885 start_codon:yes stop_codon:yes gene_type:complete